MADNEIGGGVEPDERDMKMEAKAATRQRIAARLHFEFISLEKVSHVFHCFVCFVGFRASWMRMCFLCFSSVFPDDATDTNTEETTRTQLRTHDT